MITRLSCYTVIEADEDNVPQRHVEAIEKDTKFVYRLYWGDLFFYHGEDGWCLDDETLKISERWLETVRKRHGLDKRSVFHMRIKRA